MQRTVLIALATAVVAAGVATGATILLTGDDDDSIPIATAAPIATDTPEPTMTTGSPSPTGSATPGSPSPTVSTRTGRPTRPAARAAETTRPTRSVSSIDCSREARFCSNTTGRMQVASDRLESTSSSRHTTSYSGVPKITMTWKVLGPGKKEASKGDEVEMLHVDVVVKNDTDRTFVFPKREIALDVYLGDDLYDRLVTKGPGFEMTPGGEMRGSFDRPISLDGSYSWRAKTWYYAK